MATATNTPHSVADVKVSQNTIEMAISALLKYKATQTSNEKLQLLSNDDYIYLNLTLKKIPLNSRTNPYRIPLPHPILDSASQICLIIDDRPQTPTPSSDEIKKLIKSQNIPISKVIKISKLKTNYKPFEAKRKLCDSYDLFLVDKRVVHLLPKLIGKEFFKKKKLPLGVDLSKKNLKLQVESALGSALLYLRTGTCCVMKVGKVAMENNEIVENVVDAIEGVVEKVPKKWDGVRSLHLKFCDSVALPVYQAMPDVRLKIEGANEIKKRIEIVKASDSESEFKELSGSKSVKSGKKKTKGRIHEVRYMDVGDGVESDDADVDESEIARKEVNVIEKIDDDGSEKIEDEDLGIAETVGKKGKKSKRRAEKEVVLGDVRVEKKGKKSKLRAEKEVVLGDMHVGKKVKKNVKSEKSEEKKTKKRGLLGREESGLKKLKTKKNVDLGEKISGGVAKVKGTKQKKIKSAN